MKTDTQTAHMKVAIRVRPNSRREMELNQRTIIKVLDTTTILFDPEDEEDEFFFQGVKISHRDVSKKINKKISMEFDRIFDAESTNEDIFKECINPLVDSVMNGYNCSVFVYGATGAGKTFTMLGSEDFPGITYLTMKELFIKIKEFEINLKFDIGISYLEVYNEQVMNLITKDGPLKLREDQAGGVIVSGLALKPIKSADQLLHLLSLGNRNRTQHPTDANSESSRSHAIFQVHIRMTEKQTGQKRTVKLSMIDLAGSERAASTKGIGVRFKEGASINKSLLALGNCINKLADGLKHIPYRDSNLTRILKDSLSGNCKTLMIANVSPSSLTYEDTYNTLKRFACFQYASRAKKIRNNIHQNTLKTNMPKDYYVKKFCEQTKENGNLHAIIKKLEVQIKELKSEQKENYGMDLAEMKSWCLKIDTICSTLIKNQEYYFEIQSKEKVLQFRKYLKTQLEEAKEIIQIDGFTSSEDKALFEAAINRYNQSISKQKDDQRYWLDRQGENHKDFKKLRKEIENLKSNEKLINYFKSKEMEIKMSQHNIRATHISKIKELYQAEFKHLYQILHTSFEFGQLGYCLLRANKCITTDYQKQSTKLSKLMRDHPFEHIKFADEQDIDISEAQELTTDIFDNNDDDCDEEIMVTASNPCKRLRSNTRDVNIKKQKIVKDYDKEYDSEHDDFPFKRPGTLKLNETKVIESIDFDSTFSASYGPLRSSEKNNSNKEIMKNILSDHNVNGQNRDALTKVLVTSNVKRQNIIKTIQKGILNKENKSRSPGKVKKSPKQLNKPISRVLNSGATNFINRQQKQCEKTPLKKVGSPSRGLIRINRAATLRANKK